MTRRRDIIAEGLSHLRLTHTESVIEALETYIDLLARWNRTWNLTAIDDPANMAVSHVLDSLSVASWLAELEAHAAIADIGSGGGLPGIPLALHYRDLQFILLDSSGKKTRFLTQARIELGLDNVKVEKVRVEQYHGEFDRVICRAFGSLAEISEAGGHLLGPNGKILAMKGKLSAEELAEPLAGELKISAIEKIAVPFLEADRHIVILEQAS